MAWRIEQSQDGDGKHQLVIYEPASELADLGTIRFHRAHATESRDGITQFAERRQLVPNISTTASWHSEKLVSVAAQLAAEADNLPPLEVYVQPRAGRFNQAQWAEDDAQVTGCPARAAAVVQWRRQ